MNEYHLLDQIGEGSFGRVYKARRKYTGRIVAIKMINKLGQTKDDLISFRREIDILRNVDHPNIMRFLDIIETDTDFCLVSELARGDLFTIIDDQQTLPEEVLKTIAAQLVSALSNLHSRRIIHRDLKPQNVLICANNALKLCDFGFARALSCTTLVLTSIKGTPLYMAPELVQEQPYDEKVDVWSLGVILYELYFGKPPFYTNSIYRLIQMIVNETITWPGQISPDFKEFLMLMLQKDPSRRVPCKDLLNHPFISSVSLQSFDDSQYRFKKELFDSAIEESLSETSSQPFQPPVSDAPDYQTIMLNPSNYTSEDLLSASKYLRDNKIAADSPMALSYASHFPEFISKPEVVDEALKTATYFLKLDAQSFLGLFESGINILGMPEMPHSALDFFIELLVIPYVIKKTNFYRFEIPVLNLDTEKADKLRDRLLSFLFTSDPLEASKTYTFMSFLSQVSPLFSNSISHSFASQVLPIITSAVIHHITPAVTAGAFAILGKILQQNNSTIQYIQPISEFIDSFLAILKTVPTDLDSFCVFSAALSFLSISFTLISQFSDFQRLFNHKNVLTDLEKFISHMFEPKTTLFIESLLKNAALSPQVQSEYFSFVSVLISPFENIPIDSDTVGQCVNQVHSLLPIHQPPLLKAIIKQPPEIIINSIPSLVNLFGVSSCADFLSEFFLNRVKKEKDSQIITSMCKAGVLFKLSQILSEDGPTTSQYVIILLAYIVLSCKVSTPELIAQSPDVIRSVFSIEKAQESGIIIAAHLARLDPEYIEILEQCGSLVFAERMLQSDNPLIRARTCDFAGNVMKHGPLRNDVRERVFPLLLEEVDDPDILCKKFALYAIGNAVFHSHELCPFIINKLDTIISLMDSNDIDTVDNAVAVVCNMLHKDESFLADIIKYKGIDKIMKIMSQSDDIANRIVYRIPMLCKYPDARKILKQKTNRGIFLKLKKSTSEPVKQVAQDIIRILDA